MNRSSSLTASPWGVTRETRPDVVVKGITAVISVSITDLTRAYVVLIFSLLNARIASKLDPVIPLLNLAHLSAC